MQLLRNGSTGPDVKSLQTALNLLGMADPPLDVDGIFGPKTEAAVTAFQDRANLFTDGIVGPMTTQALVAFVFMELGVGAI
jgi:peptidoglycan hydrolase-like protein with peptidoglycan-binding domain